MAADTPPTQSSLRRCPLFTPLYASFGVVGAQPVLQSYGTVRHVGAVGQGSVFKVALIQILIMVRGSASLLLAHAHACVHASIGLCSRWTRVVVRCAQQTSALALSMGYLERRGLGDKTDLFMVCVPGAWSALPRRRLALSLFPVWSAGNRPRRPAAVRVL